jgi:agmatinase
MSEPGRSASPNFLGLDPEWSDADSSGLVILPVPYEKTSTYGRGSARGPAAIIAASNEVELFDAALGLEPYRAVAGIATLEPLRFEDGDGQALCESLRREAGRWLDRNKFLVTIGGEHTSIVGAIRAHCDRHDELTVLQLDAHSDLRPEYQGSRWNHACAMARVLDFHADLAAVGIRSQTRAERELATERGIPVIYAHEIHADGGTGAGWLERVLEVTSPHVYVSLDCDVMDPSIMPSTGTPEPGGLSWQQIDALLERLCRRRRVVGLDVSELAPIEGLVHPDFTMAKLIYRFIGHLIGGRQETAGAQAAHKRQSATRAGKG